MIVKIERIKLKILTRWLVLIENDWSFKQK